MPDSLLSAVLGDLRPKSRSLLIGALLSAGALGWLDHRIDAHVAPVVAAVDAVGADVRDLSRSVRATQTATDARLDANDVRYAGMAATVGALYAHVDAAETQPSYAGVRR